MRGIYLLKQELGLVSTTWLYRQKVNSNAEFLSLLNSHPQILVPRNQDGISHRFVASELNHIRYQQGIDTLLLANGVYKPKS